MGLLLGVAQKLAAASIGTAPPHADVLTAVEPVIVFGEMLEKPDAMIAIITEGGEPADRILGRKISFQVITRDLDYLTAEARAEAIHQELHAHQGALDGVAVGIMLADQEPFPLGRDATGKETGRWEFSQTFTVTSK